MTADLPFIDEFETTVEAAPADVFVAVCRKMARSFEGLGGRVFTALLGCRDRGMTLTVPPVEGQCVNGFRVARVAAPGEVILEGQHRFAAYRLSFFVDRLDEGRSRLRARTDALFPGIPGAVYRLLVIGSGAHGAIVRQMLRIVAAKANTTDC